MLCRESNTMYSTTSSENQELIKFENSWSLNKIPFQELEAVCRRSAKVNVSKLLTLLNSHFSLLVPLEPFELFSASFEDLLAFFIMSGKGNSSEKNSALWYLFDTEIEGFLSKIVFKKLIKTVVRISVEISLSHYLKINKSPKLSTWYQKLTERMESLEIRLVKHFLKENESITFEIFKAKCEEMPFGFISSLSGIRIQLEHTQVIPSRFANPFKEMKVTKLTNS